MSFFVSQGSMAALPKCVVPPPYGPSLPNYQETLRRCGCRKPDLFLVVFTIGAARRGRDPATFLLKEFGL
jgi:hypothetical protein